VVVVCLLSKRNVKKYSTQSSKNKLNTLLALRLRPGRYHVRDESSCKWKCRSPRAAAGTVTLGVHYIAPTHDRFPILQEFCGGLPSGFPNTATVESNYCISGWEKDDCRAELADFSVEGKLHCKQFKTLLILSHDVYKYEETPSGYSGTLRYS
jgi:hypothetical protein